MSEHGGTTRKSMSNNYKPLNRRQPQMVKSSVLILFMISVLIAGVIGFYAFDKVENQFRSVQVARR